MKWVLIVAGILILLVAAVAVIGAILPKNHLASRTSRFRQPPQAIWDVITGPADWRPEIRSFEKLPSRDGRRHLARGKTGRRRQWRCLPRAARQMQW